MCKEIGGYIELDTYRGTMLHRDGIKLNSGRSALEYLIKGKNIKNIYLPRYMCDSNETVLKKYSVGCRYYSIGVNFKPNNLLRRKDEWLYIVNFYGQLSNEYISSLGNNVIVDNAQAYFQEHIKGFDTLYTCRKFFGVPDGAILYSDCRIEGLEQDVSYNRMNFLLGRFEKGASKFYHEYVANNEFFSKEKCKKMSRLTENLLKAIDYDYVKKKRNENFIYLHEKLSKYNKLSLEVPEGAFMYPLYINDGNKLREKLVNKKIYIPMLWPNVIHECSKNDLEYDLATNIVPIPVDQRYTVEDMEYIACTIDVCLHK